MRKNTPNQKWRVFAFNRTTGAPVTGDAANITARIAIDYAALADLTDVNPVEAEDGYYYFDITQPECNGYSLELFPQSSTPNIVVLGDPPSFSFLQEVETVFVDEGAATVAAASLAFGPKRVRTPNLEVEQFDPLTIQRMRDKENSTQPLFENLSFSVGSPNNTVYYKDKTCCR